MRFSRSRMQVTGIMAQPSTISVVVRPNSYQPCRDRVCPHVPAIPISEHSLLLAGSSTHGSCAELREDQGLIEAECLREHCSHLTCVAVHPEK